MRFHGTIVSLLIFTSLISLTGCGSSSGGSSTSTPPSTPSTANEWTWVSGSNTINGHGVYGTLGTASASNVPGARQYSVSWTDSSGNLWLFGGEGVDSTGTQGTLNDLWEFNPTAKEWTWMSGANSVGSPNGGVSGVYGTLGVAASGNAPGSRNNAVSWIDSSGNLWLFGGSGVDSVGAAGQLNDLWEFNPTAKRWTWMSGANSIGPTGIAPGVYGTLGVAAAGNVPGGRLSPESWIDSSGKLWLFGGGVVQWAGGYRELELNDLWEFDPAAREWTWVGGANTEGASGVYGTLGTAAAGNVPGARTFAVSWTDSGGNLWLFGGDGYDATGWYGLLSDLWEFNPTTKEWAWVSGPNSVGTNGGGASGVYGTLGVAATGNVPGGRYSAVSWIDGSGNLWLFGGDGVDSTGMEGYLNDLWKFDPATKEWMWRSGSNSLGPAGITPGLYGTLGTSATGNAPGGREYAVSWIDSSGNLWLFGGYGFDSTGTRGYLNDLWKYQP